MCLEPTAGADFLGKAINSSPSKHQKVAEGGVINKYWDSANHCFSKSLNYRGKTKKKRGFTIDNAFVIKKKRSQFMFFEVF